MQETWYARRGSGRLVKRLGIRTRKSNWKYATTTLEIRIPLGWVALPADLVSDLGLCGIAADATLWCRRGYAWDGASGPMPDFAWVMWAALGHDILYQLFREGKLPSELYRYRADEFLRDQMIRDSWSMVRGKGWRRRLRLIAHWHRARLANAAFWAVQKFAAGSARADYRGAGPPKGE